MPTLMKMHKVLALPGTLEANSMYLVADPVDTTKFSIHQTNSTGTASRELSSGSGTSTQPIITSILADATLTGVNQDVLVNSSLGSLDIYLPLVSSMVEIRIMMAAGSNRVRIYAHPSDPNNLIIGRNRVSMNSQYDSISFLARGGKWYIL